MQTTTTTTTATTHLHFVIFYFGEAGKFKDQIVAMPTAKKGAMVAIYSDRDLTLLVTPKGSEFSKGIRTPKWP